VSTAIHPVGPAVRAALVASAMLLAWQEWALARMTLSAAGGGQVRAIVIGINEYDSLPTLRGAVDDARDFDVTLRNLGVTDLTVFLERKATRQAIVDSMTRLIGRVRAGDLVIITFAGHGIQEPERMAGSEPDGLDETFVLPAFQAEGPASAERILDKEFNRWLRALEGKQADVIFVADACFGGGLVRSVDPRAETTSYRTAGRVEVLTDALKPITTASDAAFREADFERVTFMSAADESTKVAEFSIPGTPGLRGALSYAVARALEGRAERDPTGAVSRRKLFEYTRQVVQHHSQGRQNIYTEPTRSAALDRQVYRVHGSDPAPSPAMARTPIRIRLINANASLLSGIRPLRVPFEVVNGPADLVWDVKSGDVVSATGDIVARNVTGKDLPTIVDGIAASLMIAELADARPQLIRLLPDNRHHRNGDPVSLLVDDLRNRYLILFNIAYDGTVQFLFPGPGDKSPWIDPTFRLPLKVQPPFGADRVVAIVSDTRLPDLERAISKLNNQRAAGELLVMLHGLGSMQTARIGTAGLFTVP
jgi:hypothetical protein